MKPIVSWKDFFGVEHVLINGTEDNVYYVIPSQHDDEGNSYTQMLSKKAILEFAQEILNSNNI